MAKIFAVNSNSHHPILVTLWNTPVLSYFNFFFQFCVLFLIFLSVPSNKFWNVTRFDKHIEIPKNKIRYVFFNASKICLYNVTK